MSLRAHPSPAFALVGALVSATLAFLLTACERAGSEAPGTSTTDEQATAAHPPRRPDRVRLQLNWIAEPEFGGIFAAKADGAFARHGLEVEIIQGGPGTPAPQLVSEGRVEFGVVSGDQILTLREKGGSLVALFAIFQVNPTALMVRREFPAQDLAQLWQSGATVAVEPGLPYITFLNRRYGGTTLRLVSAGGGVAAFESGAVDAQQCFISAEPAQMELRGVPVRVLPLAESGYNPYAAVIVANERYLAQHRDVAVRLVTSLREGWEAYQEDPARFNGEIHALNRAMSVEAMNLAATLQHDYIAPADGEPWGSMTVERWSTLAAQMAELGLITRPPVDVEAIFLHVPPAEPITTPAATPAPTDAAPPLTP